MKYKVVLDSNVIISSVLSGKGNPAKILDLVIEDKLELLISHAIFDEIRRVLFYKKISKYLERKKKTTSEKTYENLFNKLSKVATITSGEPKLDVIKDDPSDNMILSCALSGKADYIVSGDSHLTDLKTFKGIKILNPNDFLIKIS